MVGRKGREQSAISVWQGDIMEVAVGGLSHDDYEEVIELS